MPNRIRISFISLLAIIGILGFETTAIGKKKPKRRAARAKATKRVTLALPALVLSKVQTVSTTTQNIEANKPLNQLKIRTPILAGPVPPTANVTATAGQLAEGLL